MDLGTAAGWVRDVLGSLLPSWAGRDWVLALPDGALVFGAPLLLFVSCGLAVKKIKDSIEAYRWTARVVRRPAAVANPVTPQGQEEIRRALEAARAESAEMRAKLDAILAAVRPPAGAPPLSPEARAAKEGAVLALVEDPAPPAREAARDLARGDLSEAFAILERDARADERAAFDKWRRLGDLAAGVDTGRARAAYEQAFRLQPGDFFTCVMLARACAAAGDLQAARAAALAAEQAAGTERERSVADNEVGDVLVLAGDLAGAKARFEADLAIAERLAAADPASAQAARDLCASLWKLTGLPGSGVSWAQVAERLEAMHARGVLAPADRRFLDQARARAQPARP